MQSSIFLIRSVSEMRSLHQVGKCGVEVGRWVGGGGGGLCKGLLFGWGGGRGSYLLVATTQNEIWSFRQTTRRHLTQVGELPSLEYLILNENTISGTLPQFSRMPPLHILNLQAD